MALIDVDNPKILLQSNWASFVAIESFLSVNDYDQHIPLSGRLKGCSVRAQSSLHSRILQDNSKMGLDSSRRKSYYSDPQ